MKSDILIKITHQIEELKQLSLHYKECAEESHKAWKLNQAEFCINQHHNTERMINILEGLLEE